MRSRLRSTGDVIAGLVAKAQKLCGIMGTVPWTAALVRHGVAAGVEHLPMLRQVGALRTVVDVGANRGQFALAARRLFPAARIISFEPLPVEAAVFRAVFANDGRTTLHQVAVGPRSDDREINISRRADSSSLLPISSAQTALFPGTDPVGTARVRVAPLAAILDGESIEPPALLKLDVQGFELQALKGCESVIQSFAWVYVECSFVELYEGQALAGEVIDWLRHRGFVLKGVHNVTYSRETVPVQGDFLFERHASV